MLLPPPRSMTLLVVALASRITAGVRGGVSAQALDSHIPCDLPWAVGFVSLIIWTPFIW